MRPKCMLVIFVAISFIAGLTVMAETFHDLPLHIEKPSDNSIRLWIGDHISSTAVSALNTDKGIVVIDTTQCPIYDQQFRKIIAREFGRNDFIYLINTHEHGDHTYGNGVYADCEIIAHENCAEGMKTRQGDVQRILKWYEDNLPKTEKQLAETEKGTDEYQRINEDLITSKLEMESFKSMKDLTFPTKTFSDSMKLEMGNMTLELYAMGGTHTASDIFIFVPEEGLLFTGDMMADTWFTDTPGCLAAFAMRQGMKRDIPLMLDNWKSLIERKDEIIDFIPGHWNGDLTHAGFEDRYNYVKIMYEGIGKAVKDGKKLEELFSEFSMKEKFPQLDGTPGFTEAFVHNGTILALWSDITGAQSACQALENLIDEKGLETAVTEIRTAHDKKSNDYFFLEAEFNAMGYRHLGEEKFDQAIAVFSLNADIHPDSWNTHDSLGEAYMKSGQIDLALASYNKSLELNPDNENGKKMIEEIKDSKAKK